MSRWRVPEGLQSGVFIQGQGVHGVGVEFETPNEDTPLHPDLEPLDEFAVAALKRMGVDKGISKPKPPPPKDLLCSGCDSVWKPGTKFCGACGKELKAAPVELEAPAEPAPSGEKKSGRAADRKL